MSKRILGYLNWKLNRATLLTDDYFTNLISNMAAKSPDQIVITGDLVNISLPEEFSNAATFLKSLGKPGDVFTICGNHDAYVPGSIRTAIKDWQPYMCGDDQPLNHVQDYPVVRVREDVAFIGCNSAEATLPFFATGYFRKDQAHRLAEILKAHKDKCRVVMIHHPPLRDATRAHKRLIGFERFQRVVAAHGAELVLHGHTHLATRNEIPGPKGAVPVICVPAAGQARNTSKRPAGRYNLFELDRVQGRWSISMEEYGLNSEADSIGLIARHVLS